MEKFKYSILGLLIWFSVKKLDYSKKETIKNNIIFELSENHMKSPFVRGYC